VKPPYFLPPHVLPPSLARLKFGPSARSCPPSGCPSLKFPHLRHCQKGLMLLRSAILFPSSLDSRPPPTNAVRRPGIAVCRRCGVILCQDEFPNNRSFMCYVTTFFLPLFFPRSFYTLTFDLPRRPSPPRPSIPVFSFFDKWVPFLGTSGPPDPPLRGQTFPSAFAVGPFCFFYSSMRLDSPSSFSLLFFL